MDQKDPLASMAEEREATSLKEGENLKEKEELLMREDVKQF